MRRRDPLELVALDDVSKSTKRTRLELVEDIAAGRLRVVFLGLDAHVPKSELERYAAELDKRRAA